mmetsp:Transcript_12238/g.22136  ORF Transcript_12238/g.22136 Transcript_12238/m.22136 type:complete len:220 (+) Transcript_12238:54-713(+)
MILVMSRLVNMHFAFVGMPVVQINDGVLNETLKCQGMPQNVNSRQSVLRKKVEYSSKTVVHSSSGKGFGVNSNAKHSKPSNGGPQQEVSGKVTMEDVLKSMGLQFMILKNQRNLNEIRRLVSAEVQMYGGTGVKELEKMFEEYPELVFSTRSAADFDVVADRVVQYGFVKSWKDKSSGDRKEWSSFEENMVERIYFAKTGQILKVEIVKQNANISLSRN